MNENKYRLIIQGTLVFGNILLVFILLVKLSVTPADVRDVISNALLAQEIKIQALEHQQTVILDILRMQQRWADDRDRQWDELNAKTSEAFKVLQRAIQENEVPPHSREQ